MKVYIANFGRGNKDWPQCLAEKCLLTRTSDIEYGFWQSDDRKGFIEHAVNYTETAKGARPTRPLASRWFNLLSIISESRRDLWIHRAKEEIWWTVSGEDAADISKISGPPADAQVTIKKRSLGWSKANKMGAVLLWDALHPKARDFLFTEGTLQQLNHDYAHYAHALVSGLPLTDWHERPLWATKLQLARKPGGKTFDAKSRTIVRMAMTALQTVNASNGQLVNHHIKNKNLGFDDQSQLEAYILKVFDDQEGLCAVTEIPMQLDNEDEDKNLRCSLDRIDSSKHYEPGNLQIVCRFINNWKSDGGEVEFRRLIQLVRSYKS